MTNHLEFQERAITLTPPRHHLVFLAAPDGSMLGLDPSGDVGLYDDGDDRVIWDVAQDGVTHAATGKAIDVDIDEGACTLPINGEDMALRVVHGPENLPSVYLEHLKREGWVCLTCVLPPDIVDGLQRVAGTDAYEHLEMDNSSPKVCQHSAVGKAITEPISLWLIREYVGTRDLHLGHPPGLTALAPYDGKRRVQGWHADIPYIPSVGGNPVADRGGPVKAVQRNVCVSDFTKHNGATAYKLGSHQAPTNPVPEWNPARHGGDPAARPYSGPEADVLEAPAGSIVLYDARTWHRAGFNHSDRKRGAMLMSFQTADVIPKRDTRPTCKRLHESPVYQEFDARQQQEITELLMNQPDTV